MSARDKAFLLIGAVIGISGILLTLVWNVEAGIVTLLILNLLILFLLMLQRRQLARIQQRTLALLKLREPKPTSPGTDNSSVSAVQKDLKISNKKIVGLLQAQQKHLDLLTEQIARTSAGKFD